MSTVAVRLSPHESNVRSYMEKRTGGKKAPSLRQEGKFLEGEENGSTKSRFNSLCMLREKLQVKHALIRIGRIRFICSSCERHPEFTLL